MTLAQVETLVRNVLAHRGVRYALVSVTESPVGWQIRLRGGAAGMQAFAVRDGRPLAVRTAILDELANVEEEEGAVEPC